MKTARAPKLSPLCLAVALALAAQDAARAEPLGPAPGNALNPAPINPTTAGRWNDEDGLGTRIPAAFSPIGRIYNMPIDPDGEADAKASGWQKRGFMEFGGLAVLGDEKAALFRQYKDVRDGAYLNVFGLSLEKPREARFFEATGGAVGRDDQYYRVQLGRYNDWKVSAYYDGIPHVFTTTYRSPWNGVGTPSLTLATLTPGGAASANATQANVNAALADTPQGELEVLRKKAAVRFDKYLSEAWKLYASFSNEKREGAQPFGAVFGGGGGGGNMEIAEPVDTTTRDIVAGLQYSGALTSFNVRASASFFTNDIDTLTFQNPLYVSLNGSAGLAARSFTTGRFDLAPDNEHYNVKAEFARSLPDFHRGSFTATAALGTMRQNDRLLAPTEFPLTGGTTSPGGVSLANRWNTTDALTRDHAEARIDTRLVDLGLLLRPLAALDVRGKLRYYETINDTPRYLSCNPLTGQWGRILNDGSGMSILTTNTTPGANPAGTGATAFDAARCDLAALQALDLVPVSGNIPFASALFDYRQVNGGVTADYRLGRASSVYASLERESFHRDFRAREETHEDKVKVGFVDRGTIEGAMRLTYEYARRGGSDYDVNSYQSILSASLGPTPAANGVAVQTWLQGVSSFRAFDLADRRQHVVSGRVDYGFTPSIDGAMALRLKDADYPSQYGRTGHERSGSATFDVNYQAGPRGSLYAFYAFQASRMAQRGVQANACSLGTTYYFYSDGRFLTTAAGAPAPATPAGTTLLATQGVTGANWNAACGTASATNPLFPDSRAWDVDSRDRGNTLGFGVRYDFGRAKLDASFTRALGRTRIEYSYNAAALGITPAQEAIAGSGPSDLVFAQNVLSATVLVPINPRFTLRGLVRYETGRVRDWHYDGVAETPMPANNALYLDAGPQDYRATVLGVFLHVRL
jgi:hypothetical protein